MFKKREDIQKEKSHIVCSRFSEVFDFAISHMSKENSYANFNGVYNKDNKKVVICTGDFSYACTSTGIDIMTTRITVYNKSGVPVKEFIQHSTIPSTSEIPVDTEISRNFFCDVVLGDFEKQLKLSYSLQSYEFYDNFSKEIKEGNENIITDEVYSDNDNCILENLINKAICDGYDHLSFVYNVNDCIYDFVTDIAIYNAFGVYSAVIRSKSGDGVIHKLTSIIGPLDLEHLTNPNSITYKIIEKSDNFFNDYLDYISSFTKYDPSYMITIRSWKGEKSNEGNDKES